MARTEMQRDSFSQLEWALSFSQTDLDGLGKGELKRLAHELKTFVRKAAGVGYVEPSTDKTAKQLPMLQSALKEHFRELAEMRPIRVVDRRGITDSQLSSTMVRAEGSIELISIEGDPYRQMVQSQNIVTQVYAALASHLVASGIVGGQIRVCPECKRLFILKLKPQPNREFHCSTRCTNRVTFRRFTEKLKHQRPKLDSIRGVGRTKRRRRLTP